ncbi:MAG: hypothetical protein MK185_06665 [Saccharospirillaceae bacterium]|nr:hypothetical protein [Saccharospirillaceae bacterium]
MNGPLCNWFIARKDEVPFQRFIWERYRMDAFNPDMTEEAIKTLLQFDSLTQLDNDIKLSQRFRNEIIMEYSKWLKS